MLPSLLGITTKKPPRPLCQKHPQKNTLPTHGRTTRPSKTQEAHLIPPQPPHHYLLLTAITLLLLITLLQFSPLTTTQPKTQQKFIIAIPFILSCLFGIQRTLHLKKMVSCLHKTAQPNNSTHQNRPIGFKGHHPECTFFNNHRIKINNAHYCAGCLGLTLGCITSIILILIYTLQPNPLPKNTTPLIFYLGLILLSISLLEHIISKTPPHLHLISNTILIISYLLIITSILQHTNNLIYTMIALLFTLLWTHTRINLSQWNHHKTCTSCSQQCKSY